MLQDRQQQLRFHRLEPDPEGPWLKVIPWKVGWLALLLWGLSAAVLLLPDITDVGRRVDLGFFVVALAAFFLGALGLTFIWLLDLLTPDNTRYCTACLSALQRYALACPHCGYRPDQQASSRAWTMPSQGKASGPLPAFRGGEGS